jgi:hypothetical protein
VCCHDTRRYDEPADTDSEERGGTPRPAPPEEEQYALSSQLVTMVGKVDKEGRFQQCYQWWGNQLLCLWTEVQRLSG